jgi:hypothetical protein
VRHTDYVVPKPLWGTSEYRFITSQDNDSVVNTASMFWSAQDDAHLVQCDHMDIVGHFQRVRASQASRRIYNVYDLLRSDSGFNQDAFEKVWHDIFAFAIEKSTPQPALAMP